MIDHELVEIVRLISAQNGYGLRHDPVLRHTKRWDELSTEPLDFGAETAMARLHALNEERLISTAESSRALNLEAFKHHAVCRHAIFGLKEVLLRANNLQIRVMPWLGYNHPV